MKATGIVRRIDDLGRVVIPKEIRRTLRIRDGDPLEIYTEKDGEVIFKKYSPMGDLQEFAAQICDSIGKNAGHAAAVCDRDSIIAVSGAPKRELLDKRNSPELEQIMEQRRLYCHRQGDALLPAVDGGEKWHIGVAAPILSEGDLMGCVLILLSDSEAQVGEAEQKLAQTVSGFLGRQMEA
ncbi:MAG: AbrB/MazE/SpoVT family DNA-binding domain-containing protein [Oscillospiraceae bacterium]|nr:AbrB/MazE/SpoVT family DNA-binding domain-containing protein [Oscillospiraceae bacterium]